MELRHFRYFLAVAEELNFRRAAERLHISQPPLSVAIHDLERELGAQLFDRSQRQIFLTEAGRLFMQAAKQILKEVGDATVSIARLTRGEAGTFRIGFNPSTKFLPFVPSAIHQFRALHPRVTLVLQEMESAAQIEAVANRKLDIGIGRNPSGRPVAGVQMAKLCAHPLVLAIHAKNPLSRKKNLAIADLRGEAFICSRPDTGPAFLYNTAMDLCWAAGFAPRIVLEVREVSTIIGLVASGLGIAIVPQSLRTIAMKGVRYLPLTGPGTSMDIFTVSARRQSSAHVARLREMLLRASASAI
ncbi:MAG: LysR substrate-binding domain-containing protein [Lautropia sp.]